MWLSEKQLVIVWEQNWKFNSTRYTDQCQRDGNSVEWMDRQKLCLPTREADDLSVISY